MTIPECGFGAKMHNVGWINSFSEPGCVSARRLTYSSSRPLAWLPARKCRHPGINSPLAQLSFDAQKLVVLGHPIGSTKRTSLDLSAVPGHRQVGDGRVL